MVKTSRWAKSIGAIVATALLAGCASLKGTAKGEKPRGGENPAFNRTAWVPLRLSRESYIAAEKRLRKKVRIGMSRGGFLRAMRLNPISDAKGLGLMASGEGWFLELSRKNQYGDVEVEEFSFGYYEGRRMRERFAVILRNGVVMRIARSSWTEGHAPPEPPDSLMSSSLSREEETRWIEAFYRSRLQTRSAFERVLPQLKRVRPGWTSAELRLALGGSLYRLPSGLVYFQEGLLWGRGFTRNSKDPVPSVILPFGYRGADGRVRTKVVVRAEGGVVAAVFWKAEDKRGAEAVSPKGATSGKKQK